MTQTQTHTQTHTQPVHDLEQPRRRVLGHRFDERGHQVTLYGHDLNHVGGRVMLFSRTFVEEFTFRLGLLMGGRLNMLGPVRVTPRFETRR